MGNVSQEKTSELSEEADTNESVCIFCNKNRKRHQGRWQKLHLCEEKTAIENIRASAMQNNDINFIQKIQNMCSQDQLLFYHNVCKRQYKYILESQIIAHCDKTDWHKMRDIYKIAYEEVCSFVSQNIINKKDYIYS